jgi:phage gp29-like protein
MATSRILGPDGQPIAMPDLQEPQTAKLAHLQRELQTHPTRGLTPSRLAKILDAAEAGDLVAQFELFEDMEEKDGHIAAEMGKRRRACVLDWNVVPPEGADAAEKKAAAQVGELLMEIPDFEDMVFDLTDAIGKGYACLEIEWHRVEGWWVPKTITHRPQSWFTLHRGYRQELRLRSNSVVDGVVGAPLTPFGWITHVHKAKSGYLERAALFRQLVWTYLFKNYSVGDLAEFLEIYGIPVRIGKYPASASEKEKATLLRAIAAIGHNAAGIIPDGMLIEFKDAATGDPKAFELMMSWCERNQSKVILGGTLTSGADGKSSTNALGNVHNEVRKDLRDGDVRQANTTLTRDLVYAMAALNGLAPGGLRRSPQFRLNAQEREDLASFSQALPPLVNMGVRPPIAWVHERLGIPVAQGNEPVLMPSAPPAPRATAAATAALPAVTPAASPGELPPPQQMQPQLAAALAPAVGAWIDQVRELVQRAQSLAEIRDGLDALLPGMTLDQYAAAMAVALRAAEMAGRYEVLQEASGGSA